MGGAAEGDGNTSGGANASGVAESAGERPGGCAGLGLRCRRGVSLVRVCRAVPRQRRLPGTVGHEHRELNDHTRHLSIHKH